MTSIYEFQLFFYKQLCFSIALIMLFPMFWPDAQPTLFPSFHVFFLFYQAEPIATMSSSSASPSTPSGASPSSPRQLFPGSYVPEHKWAIIETAPLPPFSIAGFCNRYVKPRIALSIIADGPDAHYYQAPLGAITWSTSTASSSNAADCSAKS